jgi:hypothetical protein
MSNLRASKSHWFARSLFEDFIHRGMKNLAVIQTLSVGIDDLPCALIPENVKIFSNAGVRDLAAEAAVRNLRAFLLTGSSQNTVIRADYV